MDAQQYCQHQLVAKVRPIFVNGNSFINVDMYLDTSICIPIKFCQHQQHVAKNLLPNI